MDGTAKRSKYGDDGNTSKDNGAEKEYEHPFWFVCQSLPTEYYDYENAVINFNTDCSPYELLQKIGRGKYSEVFKGRNRGNNIICVLKILKPVRYKKIKREISILRNLCGGPNVVRLLDLLKDERTGTPILVTEYVNKATTLRSLMMTKTLTNFDLRYYLYEVLRTLDFAHRRGIFHRDIKPHNVMIDNEKKVIRVIDWGLGEYYIHGEALNCGVATRHYKGPELLVGYRHYDYSLDIWCVGCVLAGMLFRCDPFFPGSSNEDQLLKLAAVFGTTAVYDYCRKYNGVIPRSIRDTLPKMRPDKLQWSQFVTPATAEFCDRAALDLLDKLLQFDHQDRPLAHEAMAHPYFQPVRDALAASPQEQYPSRA
ncbi:casein kinase II subunit alpha [Strigomonas culicis]|uniref:non-specific serine/threonine protein kinase n=1 Tax=Strigomonas culicis TaxID=28005 RepID=S9UPD3_9TRYP|nr:casein kinase II subunit alpha [Strigomonas culicis]|eukprot:EPY30778.1 casein kinase II subunit alpha [Strigomonas culicis]